MTALSKLVKKLDLFRKIDESYLASATAHGGSCSLLAYVLMAALTIFEFSAYMSSQTTTAVLLDVNQDETILITFSITMLDLPCRHTVVDVYDSFGWERQNITKTITKTRIHLVNGKLEEGEKHEEEETKVSTSNTSIDPPKEIELDEDGHHALDLQGEEGFYEQLRSHHYTLMNFYAPWCH